MCHSDFMAKPIIRIPDELTTSPISIACPSCGANPDIDCETTSGGLSAVHILRIEAAALIDKNKKSKPVKTSI
jgi:hypothetical protein